MRKIGWGIMVALASLVAVYALAGAVAPGARTEFVRDLFSQKALRALGHLTAGSVAIVAGAVQFNTRIRFGAPHIHRLIGKLYLVAVLISGVSGGLLAPWSSGGVAAHFGFGLLAILWVATAALAWRKAVAGDYLAHRAWMIRSFALCLAAVTLRLYLPIAAIAGLSFDEAYPAIAWLCWVPNLVVAEWFLLPSTVAPLEPAA